jgi:creatinine amidohydrolase
MRFQDLNWQDVASYLQQDDRVIMITGATEQHAYNSLLTDIEIPHRLAQAVAQNLGVLIAPPLNFGMSPAFMQYPGTISLRQTTFDAVVADVLESLVHHGFKRILILNGHGGNRPPVFLAEWRTTKPEIRIHWHEWWRSPVAQQFADELRLSLGHANWSENFPFVRVADAPTTRKPPVNVDYSASPQQIRAVLGDGSTGDYYQIDDAQMGRFFDLVVAEISAIVAHL